MRTITILDKDETGLLKVTLLDLLRVCSVAVSDAEWTVSGLELIGVEPDALYELERSSGRVSTNQLEALAKNIDQVVDGEFAAYERGDVVSLLRLRAVDSSSWDVVTDRSDVLESVRRSFVHVHDAGDVG